LSSLRETAVLFLRLGTTAFGGPAAHVAMMEEEIVRRRRWLSREQFLDYLGVTNLIPGPNSTELAMLVGLGRHGWTGLLVAGTCFILPAAIIVCACAWAYVRYAYLPQVEAILYGVVPVVIAIIVRALWQLPRPAVKSPALGVILALSLAAAVYGVHELVVLIVAGASSGLASGWRRRASVGAAIALALEPAGLAMSTAAAGPAAFSLWTLLAVFLKIGATLFGSGYVLLAFLRADFVERLGWLTERQILDAVAVGQVTPGPLFTTATFIGVVALFQTNGPRTTWTARIRSV
jgi:chromate transporter